MFFGALAFEDVNASLFVESGAPIRDHVILQLACHGSISFHVDGAATLLGPAGPQLVVVDLIDAGQHLTGFFHLLMVAGHLIDADLPLRLVLAHVGIWLLARRQHLVAQKQ